MNHFHLLNKNHLSKKKVEPQTKKTKETDINKSQGNCNCSYTSSAYVFSIGKIKVSFPSKDILKEYEHAANAVNIPANQYGEVLGYIGYLDQQKNIPYRPYLYLAQKVQWVWCINEVDSYILLSDSQLALDQLISAIQVQADKDYAVLIGDIIDTSTNNDEPEQALFTLPRVAVDHLYTIDNNRKTSLPLQPNDGGNDTDRALNYFSVEFESIATANPELTSNIDTPNNCYLSEIKTEVSDKEPTRILVEIILTYENEEKKEEIFYSVHIDVTNIYPFIAIPLRAYTPSI